MAWPRGARRKRAREAPFPQRVLSDPKATFKVGPMNGWVARESGPRRAEGQINRYETLKRAMYDAVERRGQSTESSAAAVRRSFIKSRRRVSDVSTDVTKQSVATARRFTSRIGAARQQAK